MEYPPELGTQVVQKLHPTCLDIQANTDSLSNAVLMSGRRRRRRPDIKTTSGKRIDIAVQSCNVSLGRSSYCIIRPNEHFL